jgi:hypothetical protein
MAKARKGLKVLLIIAVVLVVVLGGSVAVLVKYANKIIKSEMESRLGKSFAIEKIDLKWGHVEAIGISLKNAEGKKVIRVGDLSVTADFMGLLQKKYMVSNVTIKDPYLFIEIDHKGNIVNPVLPLNPKPETSAEARKPEIPAPPITVKKIEVVNGSVDYLDRKTPVTPVLTKIRTMGFVVKDVSVPFTDTYSDYVLAATIPGNHSTATIKSNGIIKIKTKDMDLKATLHSLDITAFKPYFQKESPVDITRGLLDLTIEVKVVSEKLHAPGTAVLKDLQFQSGPGMGSKFMGVPLFLVVAVLKKSNNEIPVNLVIEGNLDNPRFDLKENLMNRISVAVAERLGLPIKGITEAVAGAGAKGATDIGSTMKGIGGTVKKLFQ